MKPGVVGRSPGNYLIAEENRGKSQLGDRLIKAVHRLKWCPLPPNEYYFRQQNNFGRSFGLSVLRLQRYF
jgi:hypothetical protein